MIDLLMSAAALYIFVYIVAIVVAIVFIVKVFKHFLGK